MTLWMVRGRARLGYVVIYVTRPVKDAYTKRWPRGYLWYFGKRDSVALGFDAWLPENVPVPVEVSTLDHGHGLRFERIEEDVVRLDDDVHGRDPEGVEFCDDFLIALRQVKLPLGLRVWVSPTT